MKKSLALIIDDEPDIRELLEITLSRMDINCICSENLNGAYKLLQEHKFDICLTDMRLPDGNGLELVAFIQEKYPQVPIAVITAHGNMESAIQALKSGAFDFLSKPVDLNVLRTVVKNALLLVDAKEDSGLYLIGKSEQVLELMSTIEKVARSQAPVFISGESGTGKDLVAKMIHFHSSRKNKPFIPVNCGAIPHDLLESELFGHVKGAFTGAIRDKEGLFKAADGGTLFLDEVADIPSHMQVKLLRAIQEKKIRPIGAQKEINIDIRILSATNRDLKKRVSEGQFREDLFYRINVIEVNVSPLRDKKDDVALLAKYILEKISVKESISCPEISKLALSRLEQYSFPGNVRELENILERAVAMSGGELIDQDSLNIESLHEESEHEPKKTEDLDSLLVEVEREQILGALEKTRWNRTAAAKILGISFRALRYRLEKLGLD
jgi:two-component system response regulator PilR (NtrC family)